MEEPESLLEAETDLEFVEEAAEIHAIIAKVTESEGRAAAGFRERWKAILYKYQEQSQLLDGFLEDIVVSLSTLLRTHATSDTEVSPDALQRIMGVCSLLSVLIVVRGYKTVVKFFPHEAQDLERVLSVLTVVKAMASKPMADPEQGIAAAEAQAVLMLWLSMLILVPFDLATIDSTATDAQAARAQRYTQLVSRLLSLCQQYLRSPGGVRGMAALSLGRLLTRPDMRAALEDFIAWAETALDGCDPLEATFLVPGVLQSLCFAFKLGQRSRLLPHTARVWALLTGPYSSTSPDANAAVAGSTLARKLSIKLLQRLALTFLVPRLAPWRYTRDDAGPDLTLTLGGSSDAVAAAEAAAAAAAAAGAAGAAEAAEADDSEDFEIAEEVEEVVEQLLVALRDKDTVVRWSAGKGIGRVTGCLPQELADEVVEQVLELFRPTESDAAWHGGCLALAELARRGLLLPARLPVFTPIIQRALAYDVRRGPHSIGAHVRDAAAYVCWAVSRAYEPHILSGHVDMLANSLLVVACYDREVNCRRAAAAAFQEAVGRLGNFPHGMDIIGVADYFAVGSIAGAYSKVAPFVNSFPEYRLALAEHLLSTKLSHWEKSLRELSAKGLAALVPHSSEFLATVGVGLLIPRGTDAVLEVRHGALVGLSALLPALQAAGVALSAEHAAGVAALIPAIDKARLYRGKGGEVMRQGVSALIAAMGETNLPLTKPQHAKVLEALDENLRSPQLYIQQAAVAALGHYCRAYCTPGGGGGGERYDAFVSKTLPGLTGRLHDANVAVRRGHALALGALPLAIVGPAGEAVLAALLSGMVPEDNADDRDVEARVNCTVALGQVCATLMDGDALAPGDDAALKMPRGAALDALHGRVLPSLQSALQDYTTDSRGDVGSLVRAAAMQAVEDCVLLAARLTDTAGPDADARLSSSVSAAAASLLKQAVERITRVREAALRHLSALVAAAPCARHVPACRALLLALPSTDEAASASASDAGAGGAGAANVSSGIRIWSVGRPSGLDSVGTLTQLLPVPQYTTALLEGLVASIGGVDAALAKAAGAALASLVDACSAAPEEGAETSAEGATAGDRASAARALCARSVLPRLARALLDVWARHAKSPRLAGPLLRTACLLASRTDLLAVSVEPQPPPTTTTDDAAGSGSGDAGSVPDPVPLSQLLVSLARAETRRCGDVARLTDAGSVLCALVPHANPCHASAVQGLLVLLISRYPLVRRHVAEQLYVTLLSMDPEQLQSMPSEDGAPTAAPCSDSDAEAAQELLLATCWDGGLDEARAARDKLAELLRVPAPSMKARTGGGGGRAGVRDENESYAALLDDFARGL